MISGVYILYLVLITIAAAFFVMVAIKLRVRGKILTIVVKRDKMLRMRLIKPEGRVLTIRGSSLEKYNLDTERVIIAEYPFMFPSILQHPVPCLIYAENNPEPLDPAEVTLLPGGMTARQLASITDESVVDDIVRATTETGKKKIPEWVLPGITILMVLVVFGVVYMLRQQIDGLELRMNEVLNYMKVR